MPRCLEPNQRFPLVLEHDKDKPEDVRPTFYFRAASAREYLAAADEVGRGIDQGGGLPRVIEFLNAHVVDWENMGDNVFAEGSIDVICDVSELWELFTNFRPGVADRKKSE